MLGLGSNMMKHPVTGKSIVRDGLVLQHNYNLSSVEPLSDGAASFDGTDDYIDTNSTFQSTFRDSFSLSMWIKAIDGIPSAEDTILGTIKSSADGVRVDVLTDGKLRFAFEGDNDDSYITTSAAVFSDGISDWTHIFCTATKPGSGNTTLVMYVNGVAVATTLNNATLYSNHTLYTSDINLLIGARMNDASSERFFNGYICNVGIWSAALSQAQVKSIMNKNYDSLSASEKTNLVSWWNLDSVIPETTTLVYDNHHGGGETLGSEVITNGGFDGVSDGTDIITLPSWSAYGSPTSRNVVGNKLVIVQNGANEGARYDTGSLTGIYKLTVDVSGDTGLGGIYIGGTGLNVQVDTYVGELVYYFTASGNLTIYFRAGDNNGGDTTSYTNISLKKINGNTGTLS